MIPELPALFNRALEEHHELVKSNYRWAGNYSFDEIDESNATVLKSYTTQKTTNHRAIIHQFINECCELDDEFKVTSEELRESYVSYCSDNEYPVLSKFEQELVALYPDLQKAKLCGGNKRGYKGIKLK